MPRRSQIHKWRFFAEEVASSHDYDVECNTGARSEGEVCAIVQAGREGLGLRRLLTQCRGGSLTCRVVTRRGAGAMMDSKKRRARGHPSHEGVLGVERRGCAHTLHDGAGVCTGSGVARFVGKPFSRCMRSCDMRRLLFRTKQSSQCSCARIVLVLVRPGLPAGLCCWSMMHIRDFSHQYGRQLCRIVSHCFVRSVEPHLAWRCRQAVWWTRTVCATHQMARPGGG